MSNCQNILTVDVEDWYHGNYESMNLSNAKLDTSIVAERTEELLHIFGRKHVKGTFFILGKIAQKYPELIKKIYLDGHEIASHGYDHQLVYKQTPEGFENDLKTSIEVIERIIDEKILGYRAPSCSITRESYWALEIITKLGLQYDASISPTSNYLYGIPDAPRYPHKVFLKNGDLVEFPFSTVRLFGRNIQFGGGFFLRLFPCWFTLFGVRTLNRKGFPALIYVHPREISTKQPKLELSPKEHFIHYTGMRTLKDKLNKILDNFNFLPVREILSDFNLPR